MQMEAHIFSEGSHEGVKVLADSGGGPKTVVNSH